MSQSLLLPTIAPHVTNWPNLAGKLSSTRRERRSDVVVVAFWPAGEIDAQAQLVTLLCGLLCGLPEVVAIHDTGNDLGASVAVQITTLGCQLGARFKAGAQMST